MWGTSSPVHKPAVDLGTAIEGTRISGRRSDFFTAGKLAPGTLGLFQQYLPGPDVSRRSKGGLFDYLIGTQQDRCRQIDSDRPGGLQVHHHLELRRLLDRQIAGLGAAGDPIDELGRALEERRDPVAHQATRIYPFAEDKHG